MVLAAFLSRKNNSPLQPPSPLLQSPNLLHLCHQHQQPRRPPLIPVLSMNARHSMSAPLSMLDSKGHPQPMERLTPDIVVQRTMTPNMVGTTAEQAPTATATTTSTRAKSSLWSTFTTLPAGGLPPNMRCSPKHTPHTVIDPVPSFFPSHVLPYIPRPKHYFIRTFCDGSFVPRAAPSWRPVAQCFDAASQPPPNPSAL